MGFAAESLEFKEVIVYEARVHWMAHVYGLIMLLTVMSMSRLSHLMTSQLALTDRRVIGKSGLVWRRNIALPYARIQVVRVQQGLLGKLFGYGSVIIAGADGTRMRFRAIIAPYEIKRKIDEAVEIAVLGHKLVLPSDAPLEEDMPHQKPVKNTAPKLSAGNSPSAKPSTENPQGGW